MPEMKRRFSLEQDFMNYSTDDLIYGYLQCKSTFDTSNQQRYIAAVTVAQLKKNMAAMIGKTARTVTNRLSKLVEKGLLKEDTKDGSNISILTENSERYQLINYDILFYLLINRSAQSIRVYVYLLNKYLWKKETNENYIFTLSELKDALGYAETTKTADIILDTILKSFYREGLIKWREIVDSKNVNGKVIPVIRKELLSVVESQDQLEDIVVERVYKQDLSFGV